MRVIGLTSPKQLFEAEPAESRVFKDVSWLQPLSQPPGGKPLLRDEELRVLASYLTEALKKGKGRNVFIHGKPGTGKTLCVLYVLDEARKYAEEKGLEHFIVYVNAGRTRSPYYTMLELVRAMGVPVPESGWQMARLKQVFEKTRGGKPMIIAVDEVDALLFKEREPLIYYLNRVPNITLILISNRVTDVAALPDRALSTLQPRLFALEPYTVEEAKTILAERAERAFQPGAVSEAQLDWIALVASKLGDVRAGFRLLLAAGMYAERDGSPKVESTHLRNAFQTETAIDQYKEGMEKLRRQKRRR